MSVGNIQAIRDWVNKYYYKQSDVNEFFLKMNAGLSAYKLTFLSSANATIHVVEDAVTDPQSYDVNTDSSGIGMALLFFHSGSTLTCTCGSKTATAQLTDYVMVINVNNYAVSDLHPTAMNSNNDPDLIHSNLNQSGKHPYFAFDKKENYSQAGGWNYWYNNDVQSPVYIGLHFPQKVVCDNIVICCDLRSGGKTATYKIQGSDDKINWTDISDEFTITATNQKDQRITRSVNVYAGYENLRLYFSTSTYSLMDCWEVYFNGYVPAE